MSFDIPSQGYCYDHNYINTEILYNQAQKRKRKKNKCEKSLTRT